MADVAEVRRGQASWVLPVQRCPIPFRSRAKCLQTQLQCLTRVLAGSCHRKASVPGDLSQERVIYLSSFRRNQEKANTQLHGCKVLEGVG